MELFFAIFGAIMALVLVVAIVFFLVIIIGNAISQMFL